MILLVLDPPVVVRETYEDVAPDPGPTSDVELRAVRAATPGRRAEFATGRRLAHDALRELGLDAGPLLPGPDRAPVWPAGAVGSVTHCAGYRAAAVARRTDAAGVGIDAEPHTALPGEVRELVSTAAERASWRVACGRSPAAERLLFSAKESVFKAWHPLLGTWFDFLDAEVLARPDGTFTAEATPPGLGRTVHCAGRWATTRTHVVTAVVLPPGSG